MVEMTFTRSVQPSFVSLLPRENNALLRASDVHPNLQKYLDGVADL
jgi:L-lactate utilization protein LutC